MYQQMMRTALKLVHRAGACDIQFVELTDIWRKKVPDMVEMRTEAAQ